MMFLVLEYDSFSVYMFMCVYAGVWHDACDVGDVLFCSLEVTWLLPDFSYLFLSRWTGQPGKKRYKDKKHEQVSCSFQGTDNW